MKLGLKLLVMFVIVNTMAACTTSTTADNNPPVCKKLRRQMVYNSGNPNVEAAWQAPSQTAKLKQLYKENGCNYS